MPVDVCDASLKDFETAFKNFKAANADKKKFLLFLADNDPATNLSWCPDCVRAEPVIYKKLDSASEHIALLRVYVGDRPTWRNPGHPWRNDSRFNLKGVPTFIRWESDTATGRLEDHEAHIEKKIDGLMQ